MRGARRSMTILVAAFACADAAGMWHAPGTLAAAEAGLAPHERRSRPVFVTFAQEDRRAPQQSERNRGSQLNGNV